MMGVKVTDKDIDCRVTFRDYKYRINSAISQMTKACLERIKLKATRQPNCLWC